MTDPSSVIAGTRLGRVPLRNTLLTAGSAAILVASFIDVPDGRVPAINHHTEGLVRGLKTYCENGGSTES